MKGEVALASLRQRDATEVVWIACALKPRLSGTALRSPDVRRPECTAQSRQFQDLIYERRRSMSPLIFSWVYTHPAPSFGESNE